MPIDINTLKANTKAIAETKLEVAWPEAAPSYVDRMGDVFAEAVAECGTEANDAFGGGGGGGGFASPSSASVASISGSISAVGARNILASGSYTSWVENTDWKRMCSDNGITFDPTTGRFTVSADGRYRIIATLYLISSSSELDFLTLRVNGSAVYTSQAYVHSSVDPVERTVSAIVDLTAGQYVEIYAQSAVYSLQFVQGCTCSIEQVASAFTPASMSVASLSNSSALAAESSPFKSTSYAAWVENTNWRRLSPDDLVVYSTDGKGTVTNTGKYRVTATLSVASSTQTTHTVTIKKNGAVVHTMTMFVYSVVSPVERTIDGIFEASASEYFEVYVTPASGSMTFYPGCTLNILRVK